MTTATTTASDAGDWSFSFELPEGATEISLSALAADMLESATTTRSVVVDITPPGVPSVSITECAHSLSDDFCLVPTTNVTLAWEGVDGAAQYQIVLNGALGAIEMGTSTTVAVADHASSTIALIAHDSAVNVSATSTAREMFAYTQPLVINEIAWAGTDFSVNDEWVELKNLSPYTITLFSLALEASDGAPYVQLSGTVGPTDGTLDLDMYVIERAASSVNGTTYGIVDAFELLSHSGEELKLAWWSGTATTTIDQTPAVETCGGWCAGESAGSIGFAMFHGTSTARISMERVQGVTDGMLAASWQSNDTYTTSGSDSAGKKIYGTPGRENSKGWPEVGWSCDSDYTAITSGQFYVPPNADCIYFTGFISEKTKRFGALYQGTIGSSTPLSGYSFDKARGGNIAKDDTASIRSPNPTPADGTEFFAAIWEQRIGPKVSSDTTLFGEYFTSGTEPPHTNFRVISWVYGTGQ